MLRLNVGCGKKRMVGFVGVDLYPTPAADVVAPAHALPYADSQVDEIFSSHLIEHLTNSQLGETLREWYRVLKPGGKLTIICPDFEVRLECWLQGGFEYRWGRGFNSIFGLQEREGMAHRNGFTVRRLHSLLPQFGFRVIALRHVLSSRKGVPSARRSKGDIRCECLSLEAHFG